MFRKVLIANRGEIAIRISRTLRELGIESAGVFTEADRESAHLDFMDQAVALGANPRSYLDVERIVDAAKKVGADALHPGYGFLSENAELAEACERRGVTFVGPSASAIENMGSKQRARSLMSAAGVPIVPGGSADTLEAAKASAAAVGYPVLIKATDGGGGKGMRRVDNEAELVAAFERTRSEALAAFGSDRVHIEKALIAARHVELQILGDRSGTLVPFYERDCSVQRRHQKILEETPCPVLPQATLDRMAEVAIAGARSIGYYSAGTFEFLLDHAGNFYFLEMNTRLQVEHPVTELVTGLDLVREMLRVAAGEAIDPEPPARRGAAIEARIYAEDPSQGFLPSPGIIARLSEPSGPFVRVDSGVRQGSRVSSEYDPLLAKLSVWGSDRDHALSRLRRALSEYVVTGVETNLSFLQAVAADPEFGAGRYDTEFVGRRRDLSNAPPLDDDAKLELALALSALSARSAGARSAEQTSPDAPSPWVLAERARLR
ncbi:MAG TPA: biotin carboxylase N-terminal domain-containing protein [Polyangiaceae bacterium]|nr:biotin carboxylase N-terminal domain-containing protein [Polyangiaceae bacterium]